MNFRGKVSSGKKKGRFFLSRENYIVQINEKLGFVPYPGTLNVNIDGAEMSKEPCTLLQGFSNGSRYFGDVACYRAILLYGEKSVECFALRPLLSTHTGVIELIHEKNLRELLGLEDGIEVEIELV